jgi:cell wall-associated NlpC family hydrolase
MDRRTTAMIREWQADSPMAKQLPSPQAVGSRKELLAGTRLIVCRRGYRHHGIYVGEGRVIHYAGRARYPHGRIEEISLQDFIGNRPVHVGSAPDCFRGEDIVRRARSRLGECRYDLLSNNCEHFCNWCQLGEARSQQVESLAKSVRLLVHAAVTLFALIRAPKWSRVVASGRRLGVRQKWKTFVLQVSPIENGEALAAAPGSLAKQ